MAEELTTLVSPILQWGFAGFALVLVGVLVWLIREFLGVMRRSLEVIPPLTQAVEHLRDEVAVVDRTADDVRDRMLAWECPFRGREQGAGSREQEATGLWAPQL